jgi:excisionase family DNA binding protein
MCGIISGSNRALWGKWQVISGIGGALMGKQGGVTSGQKSVLSIVEVANHLGVCRQTVYNYIYYEGMPSIKVRGMRRVYLDSLHTWLKEREQVLA